MFLLLNPFLLIVYLLDLVRDLDKKTFSVTLIRAGTISFGVFVAFCTLGNLLFERILQAKFASFQVFGGVIFLIIGIRFVFMGDDALATLRGNPKHLAGAVAMPIMIGPGTVSASVLAGRRLDTLPAILSILVAITSSVLLMLALKWAHDYLRPRNTELVERYVEIAGKVAAMVVGTFSIEMIFQGIKSWYGCV
jgi:multiple antibiotic resistance protein